MGPHPRSNIIGVQRLATLPRPAATALLGEWIEAGVNGFDAADVYGNVPGEAETLLAPWSERVHVATKVGLVRSGRTWRPDGRASHIRSAAEASRNRLQVHAIDLLQLHVPDPSVKFATSLRALARLLDRGVTRAVGLCNVQVHHLREALDILPISAVQISLGPFDEGSIRSGIVEEARAHQIPVLAYRPLGGVKGVRRVRRHPFLVRTAADLRVSPEQIVLAWLRSLGVIPLPGPTRSESGRSCIDAAKLVLEPALLAELDVSFEAGRQLRRPRAQRRPGSDADGDVVMIMGSPGAGKSTLTAAFPDHHRLNRDERGGRLAGLIRPLETLLAAGDRRVVLDNTYPTRASRNRVIEAAWRHGAPVRCTWLKTPNDLCEVQVVGRILDRLGRLPEPGELDGQLDGVIPPSALHRYRRQLESPEVGEGFASVDAVPHTPRPAAHAATAHAVFVDAAGLDDPRRLRRDPSEQLVVLGWIPTADASGAVAEIQARAGPEARVWLCPHPAGAPVCWCRKPLPGLGVLAVRALSLDPARCRLIPSSSADVTFARKLGFTVWADDPP